MTKSETAPVKFWEDVPPCGPIWRPEKFCKQIGVSKSQAYWMIAEGLLPPFIKLSERASGMPDSWLRAYLEHRAEETLSAMKNSSTSESHPVVTSTKASAGGIDQ